MGPFAFQTSRIVHYLVYFLIAVGVGTWGLERGLLALDGKLVRRWPLWVISALLAFGLAAFVAILTAMQHPRSLAWALGMDLTFVLSCAASSFAFLALFIRFVKSRSRLFESLSRNFYGIYLVHYAFVSWLQYALLPAALPAVAKGFMVFAGALALSWGTAAALRRIPAVGRVL
jgi:surface polysaccharide O-acyltransferase-like enzyme